MVTFVSGYGVSIPTTRIALKDIHTVWQNTPWPAIKAKGVQERTVLGPDEDTVTLAVDAAFSALEMAGINGESVGALFLGTQTSPYLTRPSATVVSEMLGLKPATFAVDLQFSGKSGTAALLNAIAWVKAGFAEVVLAVGADTLSCHVSPGDTQEYTAASGGSALVITSAPGPVQIVDIAYYATDTPDGFRLDGERYIRSGGASMTNTDVGMPLHVSSAWKMLQERANITPGDIHFVVMPQMDARSGVNVAKRLGFSREKIEPATIAPFLGDCGAASSFIGLAAVFDQAKSGQKIALLSYGVGAGSDAVLFEIKKEFQPRRKVQELIERKKLVDYSTYIKYERKYDTTERRVSTFD